jgi:hypothetical protein
MNMAIFFFVGNKIRKAKTDVNYWRKYGLAIILSYGVFMGLRFGRMIDYNVYYFRYVRIGENFGSEDYEFFFKSIIWLLNNLGVPYWIFIFLCSILLISSVLFVLKKYRKYIPLALLFFLWEAHNAELLIRWYIGFAFFLYSIGYLERGKYGKFALFALMALGNHVGMIIIYALVVPLFLIKKVLVPWWVVLPLFAYTLFYGTVTLFSILTPFVGIIGVDERSLTYAEHMEDIINGEYGTVGTTLIEKTSTFIRTFIAYAFPVLISHRIVKAKLITPAYVHLFYIGVIFAPMLNQVEIMNRYGEALTFFSVIVSPICYYYYWEHRKSFPIIYMPLYALSLLSYIFPLFSDALSRDHWSKLLFIWDAGGRDTISTSYFL